MTNAAQVTDYEYKITFFDTRYDEDERHAEVVFGTQVFTGTEDGAVDAAREAGSPAGSARIERVAVAGGARFRDHETLTFTIGL